MPFHWHGVTVVLLVALALLHGRVVPGARERRFALGALTALGAVTLWPVGDLAASVSLSVATVQRLVVMLLVAPWALLSLPTPLLARLTRPSFVDALTRRLAHPGVAMLVVSVFGTLTLVPPVVDGGARWSLVRGLTVLGTLVVGVVLWIPALALLPGTRRLSPTGRAGYVFVSALVVTSLSIVWIFAHHSLYPGLHYQFADVHMTALLDQQLAGFIAKFGSYVPMGAVAFTIFARARDRGAPLEEGPLYFADVERELLRVDRQRARSRRRDGSGEK